jgi:antitoxin FitA
MTHSLSIKDVPAEIVDAVRERARRNHRSMQGELLHIIETAVGPKTFQVDELIRRVQAIGLSTPSESAAMVREDRDRR